MKKANLVADSQYSCWNFKVVWVWVIWLISPFNLFTSLFPARFYHQCVPLWELRSKLKCEWRDFRLGYCFEKTDQVVCSSFAFEILIFYSLWMEYSLWILWLSKKGVNPFIAEKLLLIFYYCLRFLCIFLEITLV